MDRPVFLIGNGCRNHPGLVKWLCERNIPVLTTWQAIDLVPEDCPAFCGRPGTLGQRAANIIQQKADRLFIIGARLDGEQVAYDYSRFAPNAEKIVYDIDQIELDKFPEDWLKINVDLSVYAVVVPILKDPAWVKWCRELYDHFRPELEGRNGAEYVDPFAFVSQLSASAQPADLIALGSSGGIVNAFLQAFKVKAGQRITVCATIGAMGADIPMALGGALATGSRTICVTGDGGFQLNAQELETINRLNLPIHFFVWDNGGYNSIRAMQDSRFNGRRVGSDAASGLTLPDIRRLARGYDIPAEIISPEDNLEDLLECPGPMVWVVPGDPDWRQYPRVASSMANGVYRVDDMQDMTPKLDPGELDALMRWDG